MKEIHTDFEIAIGKGCKNIYPNVKIKYCIFYMLNALDLKKNNLCKKDIIDNDDVFIYYNMICNLYLCDPLFVKSVFKLIETNNSNENFNRFLNYFKITYIKNFL